MKMAKKSILDYCRGKQPSVGTVLTTSSTEVAQILSCAGFEWLLVNPKDSDSVLQISSISDTLGHEFPILLRVSHDDSRIKSGLASGFLLTTIPSLQELEGTVDKLRQKTSDGHQDPGYIPSILLEVDRSLESLSEIEPLLNSKLIDGLFLSPDLSPQATSNPHFTEDDQFFQAVISLQEITISRHLLLGAHSNQTEIAKSLVESGLNLVAIATDCLFVENATKNTLSSLRPTSH